MKSTWIHAAEQAKNLLARLVSTRAELCRVRKRSEVKIASYSLAVSQNEQEAHERVHRLRILCTMAPGTLRVAYSLKSICIWMQE